jgi:subtilisin family serine protease/tetratricopeptide (TPR) repeat protein
MSVAYIIHCDADLDFVRQTLLRPLPSRGFERWVSSAFLRDLKPAEVMPSCGVILAVVSRAAAGSASVRAEIEEGRASSTPMIAVQAENLTDEDRARFPKEVWLLPLVDLCEPDSQSRRQLAALLPPAGTEKTGLSDVAQPIDWNEETFSEALSNALNRHDHNQTEALIEVFNRHIKERPYPYPPKHANTDLGQLRGKRQFKLMRRYGETVIDSGTSDAKVRRQYAQSLIEQQEFDRALKVLNSIVQDPDSAPSEVSEAYGLIGRTYKQQYVDNPKAPGSHTLLHEAMKAYRAGYEKDPLKVEVWHGVNLASCIIRADRDGVEGVDVKEAREIAERVLKEIDRREQAKKSGSDPTKDIDVWDYASKIEALLVLQRYDEAMAACDAYICHPDMQAFEVSSTYRQFDQLLQLGRDPRGKPILDRLWEAVQRHRGVGFAELPPILEGLESLETKKTEIRPLLIRVADPQWQPGGVADLSIESRLGTIVSAQGSDASVKQLLKDPDVIAVNDSAPAGIQECLVSVPFIRVAENYPGPGGPYVEKGAKALIAIVDNGIDVLHQAFLDANGQSRIVGIWDQTDSTGAPPPNFSYGTYHDAAAIAGYTRNKATPAALGRNTKGGGHGTHVASIAAGRKGGAFAGGVAPEAKILVVVADGQSPTGYSKSHVDALFFIDKFAKQLQLPVVVNVSQGMNAGAHDGLSLLEVAFDEFSGGGRRPGRVIVKSAGNERSNGGHAKVTLAPDALELLTWSRDPQALVSERLELWWNSADEIEFRLGTPTEEWTSWVGNANPNLASSYADGTPYNMEFTRRHIDNGDSQLRIKIGQSGQQVAPGTWQLELKSSKVPEGGEIHAWIERGVGEPSSFTSHANEEMTLSIPGTARTVITVGAVKAATPTRVGGFSSYGPTRDQRKKPEVCAPGLGVNAAKAGTDTDVVAKDGTSMAAPHVTGAIALLLSHMSELDQPIPTASQITSAIRQKTINYTSNWDRGQGFGIVDVAALLAAF